MEFVTAEMLNGAGVVGLVVVLFWLLATGRLVTRREADAIRADRDDWKNTAQRALGVAQSTTVAAEVTADVVSRLPDPGRPL